MPRPIAGALVCLSLVACTTVRTRTALVFPDPSATEYVSPDGGKWAVLQARQEADGTSWVAFRRGGNGAGEWSEMLVFGLRQTYSLEEARKMLDWVKVNYDPASTYVTEGGADDFRVMYHLVRSNESGFQRVVRTPRGYFAVFYQERLGPAGESRLRFWTKLIKSAPPADFLAQGQAGPAPPASRENGRRSGPAADGSPAAAER